MALIIAKAEVVPTPISPAPISARIASKPLHNRITQIERNKQSGRIEPHGCREDTINRGGFTLIELMVVLTLIGLITATAAVRLSGVTHQARREWAIERILATESFVRAHAAKRGQREQFHVHLGTGHIRRVTGPRKEDTDDVDLSNSVRVTRYWSLSRDADSGEIAVDYSPYGTAETFALEVKGTNKEIAWILFAGITGQVTRLEDDRHVKEALEAIRQTGADSR